MYPLNGRAKKRLKARGEIVVRKETAIGVNPYFLAAKKTDTAFASMTRGAIGG
jgi:hypothetical protein